MFARLAEASTTLDIGTLFVIATCVAALLGLFLLFAWLQDRVAALAWWGAAYLIGGFSGLLWRLDGVVPLPLSDDLAARCASAQCATALLYGPRRIFRLSWRNGQPGVRC